MITGCTTRRLNSEEDRDGWYRAVVPYANTTATVSLVFTNVGSLYVCGSEGDVSDVYRKIQ